jgi:hypothetical protein
MEDISGCISDDQRTGSTLIFINILIMPFVMINSIAAELPGNMEVM